MTTRLVGKQAPDFTMETAFGNGGVPNLGRTAAWWERRLDVVVPVHKFSDALFLYSLLTIV